jgi:co-chaperonin GroES (HSP10)
MPLKAYGDKIVVERDPPKPAAEDGILIPASLERTPRFNPTDLATIISVGPRCKVKEFREGGRLAIKTGWGDDFFHDDRTFTILTEREYRDCCLA